MTKLFVGRVLGEAGTLNFAGGTINWKKKKKLFKSNFAISDKS